MVLQPARAQSPSHESPRRRAFVPSVGANSLQSCSTDGPRGHCRRLVYSSGVRVDLLTLLIVGLIAGLLASAVVGGIGYGLIGDIVVGVVGALLGGWIFSTLGIGLPIAGLPGTIVVAFVGSIVLLLLHPGTPTGPAARIGRTRFTFSVRYSPVRGRSLYVSWKHMKSAVLERCRGLPRRTLLTSRANARNGCWCSRPGIRSRLARSSAKWPSSSCVTSGRAKHHGQR